MNTIINHFSAPVRMFAAAALLATAATTYAATDQPIKGRVVDPDGNPIAGAVVNVSEQSKIVLSDANGYFTITGALPEDEVNASCVGYETNIVPVEEMDKELIITLTPDTDPYSHMMSVAFDEKPIRLMVEATSTVKGTDLQKYPVTVLQNAFNSVVNGVQTYEASTEPGWGETKLYIRGLHTLNGSARNPIFIVDNVERDISFLDAFPIENVTILKDAAATAIYGMRGANGVVLVTTKRGKIGKPTIEFTQEVGWQQLTNTVENQNSYNIALTRNRARYLDGNDPLYTPEQIEKYRRVCEGEELEGMDKYRYFNTNWFDQLYRDSAPVIKTNLQISGGNNRARYYVSFSYLRQEGMWSTEGTHMNKSFNTQHVLNRWNLRSNLDINVHKYLRVGLDLGGRIDNIIQPTASVFNLTTFGAVEADPMHPVYCPNGEIFSEQGTGTVNPLLQLGASGQEKNRRRQLYSTLTLNGDLSPITKGLGAEVVVSFDAYDGFESTQTNSLNAYTYNMTDMSVDDPSKFTYSQQYTYQELTNPSANERDNSWTLNLRGGLSYNRLFGKHHIEARAFVRAYQKRLNKGPHSAVWYNLSSDRYLSYNGIINYAFDNRYILHGTISRMGNDNFDPSNRWGTFWSAGAGWVISSEPWMPKTNINLIKIRGSYGTSGMSDTGAGRYPYQSTYVSGTGYSFGFNATNIDGYREEKAGNPNSKWEVSKMANIGLDWGFFNNRIYGSADIWKEWRSNMLVSRSTIPAMIGITYAQDSYGKVESKGFELTIGHTNKIKNVEYGIEGMLSYNTNKVTEMDETEPAVPWQRRTGERIRQYESVQSLYESENRDAVGGWNAYRWVQWASDPNLIATSQADAVAHPEKYPYNSFSGGSQKLGTAVFRDLNGDRMIDSRDMEPYGYTILPDLTPSLTVWAKYMGFDIRVVGTAYLHRSVFLSPSMTFSQWGHNNATHAVTDAWGYYTDDPVDPRNVNAKYPRISYTFNAEDSDRSNGSYQNDKWIVNGDYFSLRNIEFGYSLPQKLISKAYMTRCRVYFSAYNVASWSHLPKGMDPERPMGYCWWYPKTRIFNFGLNLSF